MQHRPNISLNLYRFAWVWSSLLLCIWFSWHLLAQFDFLYPIWHDYAGIGQNIEQYGPLNQYRDGFESTTDATRFELFHGIVNAIHNHGQGLAELAYPNAKGMVPLLHSAEIVHLQDVANLIDQLNQAAIVIAGLWLLLTLLIWQQLRQTTANCPPMISNKISLLNIAIGLLITTGLLLVIGTKTVFYQLHIWIFPDNHQWFFYYQESLMSTMMKAPDLFAWIAASLLVVALLIYLVIHMTINRFKGAR